MVIRGLKLPPPTNPGEPLRGMSHTRRSQAARVQNVAGGDPVAIAGELGAVGSGKGMNGHYFAEAEAEGSGYRCLGGALGGAGVTAAAR